MISRPFISSGKTFLSLLFLFLLLLNQLSYALSYGFTHFDSEKDPPLTLLPSLISDSKSYPIEPVKGKLIIIAVMVEFEPDNNQFTSGNGTFKPGSIPYLESPGTPIDALPHDRGYFEAHLAFTKNYFEKISNRQLTIDFQVLPDIYRLDQQMEAYSPIGRDPDFLPLAILAKDVWELVGADPNVNIEASPTDNIAFVIFHAGIGRDVELTGTLLDKTPQDIPSAYLSKHAFQRLFDDPSFAGFEIDHGNLIVDNTLILPRTLSRSGEDFSGNRFVIPLSINGMLTAQVGRHIGLPDLFNTKTGKSGIGRFGLMDGAGVFAYNGLFPPELSAWEKIHLGWDEPFEIRYDHPEPIKLPSAALRRERSIARVSLSNSEYFLIENRHRDPDNSGVTITIRRPDGSIVNQTFTNRDTAFVNQTTGFDNLLEPGVIIDVSNYDFALPGGTVNEPNSQGANLRRELNGGILIWHIDETVIRDQIQTIGVNSNPERKGVELQEADGAQDIGRPTNIGLTQNEFNGSAFDFWWSGNNSTVIIQSDTLSLYQNRFGPDTFPNNRSHTGAPSLFELFDFSDNLQIASFRIQKTEPDSNSYDLIVSESIESITTSTPSSDSYWNRYPLAIQQVSTDNQVDIIIPGMDGLLFYNLATKEADPTIIKMESLQQPLTGFRKSGLAIAPNPLFTDNEMRITHYDVSGSSLSEINHYLVTPNRGFLSFSEPSIIDVDGTELRINTDTGKILTHNTSQQLSERINQVQSRIEGHHLIINYNGGSTTHPIQTSSTEAITRSHTGLLQKKNGGIYVYLLLDDTLSIFSPDDQYSNRVSIISGNFIGWPAFSDYTENGSPDILYVDPINGKLNGKNIFGTVLDGFPIYPVAGKKFTGTPLIADINGDGAKEIVITAQDQYSMSIYAYNSGFEIMEGFPLLVGGASPNEQLPIHPLLHDQYLIAVSPEKDLKIWKFPKMRDLQWGSKYGSMTNNKVTGFITFGETIPVLFTLLNRDETYNWPNPARDETFIRFQTVSPSDIRIKITSLSGRLMADERIESMGGLPEELRLDTSGWGSGAYFALLEATTGGTTERKLIKIAIVR